MHRTGDLAARAIARRLMSMSGLFVIMALPVLWRGRGATSQPRGKRPAGGCAVRQIMFQTRVNPNTLERVASSRAGAEYWLSSFFGGRGKREKK